MVGSGRRPPQPSAICHPLPALREHLNNPLGDQQVYEGRMSRNARLVVHWFVYLLVGLLFETRAGGWCCILYLVVL